MVKRLAQTLVLLLPLTGCASRPPPFDVPKDGSGQPTVDTIRRRIRCELYQIAVSSQMNQLLLVANDVEVALQLTLDVTEEGGLAPTFTYLSGPLTVASGFNLDRAREQSITIQLFYSMGELRKTMSVEQEGFGDAFDICSKSFDTDLSGVIGLKEAFDLATTATTDLNWNGTGSNGAFGGYVNFIVKKQLTATGPTWSLAHFKGPGNFATLSANTNDKLVFAFTKGKKAAKNSKELSRIEGLAFINSIVQGQLATNLNFIRNSTQ